MDFPQFKKMVQPAGVRGPFPTNQFFMFLSERETINVRLDNVFSIGYANDMPVDIAAKMLEMWDQSNESEFKAAYRRAEREIGLKAEMAL